MRKSLKISRGAQLMGALLLVAGIVSCSQRSAGQDMPLFFIGGLLLIIGGKVYEWMSKE